MEGKRTYETEIAEFPTLESWKNMEHHTRKARLCTIGTANIRRYNMKRTSKQIFSMTLCILLLLSWLPVSALAVQTDAESILREAYALEEGMSLPYEAMLTGQIISIDTPYSLTYKNITVTICVPGYDEWPISCYRLKGEGAEYLAVGDTITVTGELTNYRGMIEFAQGCELSCDIPVPPEPPTTPTPEQIVDAAYALEPGKTLPYQAALTGRIVEIVSPYDENYHNITVTIAVEGKEDMPIVCYRMRGNEIEFLQTGDVITVHGTLQNYAKYDYETDEILYTCVEFSPCTLIETESAQCVQLYCWAPSTWNNCYVYTWNYNGPMSGEWPGTQMTNEGNGLWSAEVPVSAEGLVFHAGVGNPDYQSKDLYLPIDERNMYVVAQDEWKMKWEFAPDFVDLSGLDSLALVGSGIPGIPDWMPEAPEGDMTQVSAGVYEKTVVCSERTVMNFKFSGNDMWDDNWNFGSSLPAEMGCDIPLDRGSGSQDIILEVQGPCKLLFTVDLTGLEQGDCATWRVEVLDQRVLTVITPACHNGIWLYSWEPEAFGPYPGVKLREYNGSYCVMIDNDMLNMVFTVALPEEQHPRTTEVFLEDNGLDVFVTLYEDGTFRVEYDTDQVRIPDSLSLCGENIPGVPDWSGGTEEAVMTEVQDNVFEKILNCVEGVSMLFRIIGTNEAGNVWNFGGPVITVGEKIDLECDSQYYLDLSVWEDCTVKLTVDLNPMLDGGNATLQVEKIASETSMRKLIVYPPKTWNDVFVYSWEPECFGNYPGRLMSWQPGRFEIMVPQEMTNLVLSGSGDEGVRYQTSDIKLKPNGKNVAISIRENCTYSIEYIDLEETVYRVAGNTDWMGMWDPASDAGRMEKVAPGVYRKCFTNVNPGNYEFKITINGTWENAIGDAGDNACFQVTHKCDVTITLTVENENYYSYSIEYSVVNIGDISADGRVNMGDVSKVYAHICGSNRLTNPIALENADFNGDGSVNIGDVAQLYAFIRGTDLKTVVDVAYRLSENQELPMSSTLTGQVLVVNEPYDPVRNDITVTIVVPERDRFPVLCTRLTGEYAKNISENDKITVFGQLRNFCGVVEFKEGCRLVDWEDIPSTTERMEQTVDEAYALAVGQTMAHPVTLTGYVTQVNRYTSDVPYISVTMVVPDKEDKPIYCYRMMGDDLNYINTDAIVTVTGTLRNYNGTIEFCEGCRLLEYWY